MASTNGNTTSVSATELLGSLEDRVKYTDEVLKGIVGVIQDKDQHYTLLMGGKVGVVGVTTTQANRLRFISGATTRSSVGREIEQLISVELARREKLHSEFRDLVRLLHGNSQAPEALVVDAVLRYEDHQRSVQAGTATSTTTSSGIKPGAHVAPRVGLRTEPSRPATSLPN